MFECPESENEAGISLSLFAADQTRLGNSRRKSKETTFFHAEGTAAWFDAQAVVVKLCAWCFVVPPPYFFPHFVGSVSFGGRGFKRRKSNFRRIISVSSKNNLVSRRDSCLDFPIVLQKGFYPLTCVDDAVLLLEGGRGEDELRSALRITCSFEHRSRTVSR